VLGLGIDADAPAFLGRLALHEGEDLLQRLDLGQCEVAGEVAPSGTPSMTAVRLREANCGSDATLVVAISLGSWRAWGL